MIKRDGNKSVFTLNGGPATGKAVQTLASSFNIQIDNLCQFLPQDKVVEFAQMSPIELLGSTQRAAAGSDMTKMHEELKQLRSGQSELLNKTTADRDQLANLENRQEMQRTEVERMRERALVKKRLEWFEKCRPVAQYAESKKIIQDAKQRVKVLKQELKRLRAISAPTLKKLDSKTEYQAKVRALKAKRGKELATSEGACEKSAKAIKERQEAIDDLTHKIEAEKKAIPGKREEAKRLQAKMADLRRKKEQRPDEFDSRVMTDQIQELRNQQRVLNDENGELEEQKLRLREQGTRGNKNLAGLAKQLEGMETQAGKQDNKLQDISRDTYQAWKWIQENRDELSQHVYGPPIVECSLKDPAAADAVESFLQENDFKIITVQNQADFAFLQRKLFKEKKLHDVSLRVCTTTTLDQFRAPLSAEEMSRFGLSGWVLEQLEGPATVLAMLCLERGLHRGAFSPRELSQQQHDELAKTPVQSYVAGRKVYQFLRRAEYGAAGTSARVRDVRPARRWTDQPVDMGRKAALQREMNERRGENQIIKDEWDGVKAQLDRVQAEAARLGADMESIRQDKDAKQKELMQWKALDIGIQDAEQRYTNLHESLNGVRARVKGLRDQMDAALVLKAEAALQFAFGTRDVKHKAAQLLEAEVLHIEAQSDLEVLKAQNEDLVRTIERMETESAEAEKVYRVKYDAIKGILQAVQTVRAEAEALEHDGGEPGYFAIFSHVVASHPTEESLDAELDAEKAKLELTEGGSAGIIKEYEERAKAVERLRARLQESQTAQDDYNDGIKEVRGQWERRLEEIVAQIDDAFSDSFARIGCAGHVAVHKASSDHPADCSEENGGADNGLDFANWSIHVRVKFREHEPLSLLDSHRQSGGERAVSTIFYLMALQSLSRAPFRVVDEINQGMDPRNERMVHGRMVDIAADDGGSQYFLITPKLLSGLKYRRGMTVLCIVSGENMPAAREQDEEGRWVEGRKVDFQAFVQKAKELGLGAGTPRDGRRTDSGVGMGGTMTGQLGGGSLRGRQAAVGA